MALLTVPYQRPNTTIQATIIRNAMQDVMREQDARSAIIQAAQRNNQESLRRMDNQTRSLQKMISDKTAMDYQQQKDEFSAGLQLAKHNMTVDQFRAAEARRDAAEGRATDLHGLQKQYLRARIGASDRSNQPDLPEDAGGQPSAALFPQEPQNFLTEGEQAAAQMMENLIPKDATGIAGSLFGAQRNALSEHLAKINERRRLSPQNPAMVERFVDVAAQRLAKDGDVGPDVIAFWKKMTREQQQDVYGRILSGAERINKDVQIGEHSATFKIKPEPKEAELIPISQTAAENRVKSKLRGLNGIVGRFKYASEEGEPDAFYEEITPAGKDALDKALAEVQAEAAAAGEEVSDTTIRAIRSRFEARNGLRSSQLSGGEGKKPTNQIDDYKARGRQLRNP